MRTGDLAKQFGVSGTTIQNWTREFPEFFSDSARGENTKLRTFNSDDYLLVATIAKLSADRLPYDAIREKLFSGYRVDVSSSASLGYADGRLIPASVVEQVIDASELRVELELVKSERDRVLELFEKSQQSENNLRDKIDVLQQRVVELTERAARAETEAIMLKEQYKRRSWFGG